MSVPMVLLPMMGRSGMKSMYLLDMMRTVSPLSIFWVVM